MTTRFTPRFFCTLLLVAAALFREAASLTNNNQPRFSSAAEQAMFGGYSTGEASLLGGSSTLYGAPSQPLWKGKAQHQMNSAGTTADTPNVPFSGDTAEAMTFVPSMRGSSSKSSFVP